MTCDGTLGVAWDIASTAREASQSLTPESAEQILEFVRRQRHADGGFAGRTPRSDLYYTLFALECLQALAQLQPHDPAVDYCASFSADDDVDFVSLAALMRCRAKLGLCTVDPATDARLLSRLAQHRTGDGGYARTAGAASGTPYECFLAFLSYDELGLELPNAEPMTSCLARYRTADGAYANEPGLEQGTTPVTAAVVVLLQRLGQPVPDTAADWLQDRQHELGGFAATARTPGPDLLSTATALYALKVLNRADVDVPLCADFVDGLWTPSGGFCGHPGDDVADCEYTFYGLLALGCLGLAAR